jgi:hypothetical protein
MDAKIAGYLEEYVRHLRLECDSLLDRFVNDGDDQAEREAEAVMGKIKDIRGIIKRVADERAKHL